MRGRYWKTLLTAVAGPLDDASAATRTWPCPVARQCDGIEGVGRGEHEGVGQSERAVVCLESGGALGDVRRERLDVDTQVGHESPDHGDSTEAPTPGIDEDLGVGARGQDQGLPAPLPDGSHGGRVVRVVGVEQGNDDARVDDDYRHSRRSFCRAPFG